MNVGRLILVIGFACLCLVLVHKKAELKNPLVDYDMSSKAIQTSPQTPILNPKQEKAVATAQVLPTQNGRFVRQYPRRQVSPKVLAILPRITDKQHLLKLVHDISSLPVVPTSRFSISKKATYPLGLMPQNNEEFQHAVQEMELLAQLKLTTAAESNDVEQVQVMAATYGVLQLMKFLNFTGKFHQGHPILEWPKTLGSPKKKKQVAQLKRWVPRSVLGSIASLVLGAPVAFADNHLDEMVGPKVPVDKSSMAHANNGEMKKLSVTDKNALTDTLRERQGYYDPLPGHQPRIDNEVRVPGDPLRNRDTKGSIESFIEMMAAIPMVGHTPQQLADANETITKKVIERAGINPHRYGYQTGPDLLDIPFEVYAKEVGTSWALWGALWGVGAATIGHWLLKGMLDMRFFVVGFLVSMGIETIITGMASYYSAQQAYLLHRYYSYYRGSIYVVDRDGKVRPHVDTEINPQFKADDLVVSQDFRRFLSQTWLVGLVSGFGISYFLRKENINSLVRGVGTFAKWSYKLGGEKPLRQGLIKAFRNPKVWDVAKKAMSRPNLHFAGLRPLSGPLGMLNNIPVVGNLVNFLRGINWWLVAADVVVTSASMYSIIYLRSRIINQVLERTHLAPEQNLQLAILGPGDDGTTFLTATRSMFYETCAIMAEYGEPYADVETLNSGEYLRLRQKRKQGCKEIIKAFKGNSEDEVADQLIKSLSDSKREENQVAYEAQRTQALSRLSHLGEKMRQYPQPFVVTWLAGIKSIFSLNYVDKLYWDLRKTVLDGYFSLNFRREKDPSYIVWTDELVTVKPDKLSLTLNLDRMEYDIERHSYNYHKKRQERFEIEIPKEIWPAQAYIAYFRYFSGEAKDSMYELRESFDQFYSDSAGGTAMDTIIGGFKESIFAMAFTATELLGLEKAYGDFYRWAGSLFDFSKNHPKRSDLDEFVLETDS